jgi:outer membrane protein OmpA-like peptidoglycan-associated protein
MAIWCSAWQLSQLQPSTAIFLLTKRSLCDTAISRKSRHSYCYQFTNFNHSYHNGKNLFIYFSGEFFNFGASRAQVNDNLETFLKSLLQKIQNNLKNGAGFELTAGTDSWEKPAYNIKLSKHRSQVIVDAILAAGLTRNRVIGK